MICSNCQQQTRKFGKDRHGNQRYQCKPCKQTFTDIPEKPLGAMRLPMAKAVQVLQLLLEGCSVRSTIRITGVAMETILSLLVHAGEKAKSLMESRIVDLQVDDIECDEAWGYTYCKEKHRQKFYPMSDGVGDAWCFYGFDPSSKLVLAWHLGKRTPLDTEIFIAKLRESVVDGFQISTDGFKPYREAIESTFGSSVNYGRIIKNYGNIEDERRYSPATVTSIEKVPVSGFPDEDRISTSYIERQNLNVRMSIRRMTRLTNGFSKKWENHEAAIALYFAYYNFCWKHSTIKMTPAMAAGLTDHKWTIEELLKAE